MNFRENNYQENYDDPSRNLIGNTGMKYSQLKAKRKGVPIDKEKLYEQNYELRGKVKQLEEINLKLNTQLIVAKKEKDDLFNMAEEQIFNPKMPQRSQSGAHKMSVSNANDKNNFTLLKEKQNSAFKKLVRDKHSENEKLRFENQNLKKTMKFTRLNELITENNELIEETKRLRLHVAQARNSTDQFSADYSYRIENLKKDLQQQRQSEKKNGVELRKQLQVVGELKEKLRDCELKKVQMEKRLNKELKTLRAQNVELRSRASIQISSKECEKPQCVKNRKERVEQKKKVEQLQKKIKGLEDEVIVEKKNALDKLFQYKKEIQSHKKAAESQRQSQLAEQKINNSFTPNKKQAEEVSNSKLIQTSQKSERPQPKINTIDAFKATENEKKPTETKQPALVRQKTKQKQVQPVKIDIASFQQSKQIPKLNPEPKKPQAEEPAKQQNVQQAKQIPKKAEEHNDSYDTQKLLQSYESQHQKQANKQQQTPKKKTSQPKFEDSPKNFQQSDGQYEQIDFQEEEVTKLNQVPKEKPKEQKKEKKERPKQKNQSQKKKEKTKVKEKSTKKLQKNGSEEQILYQNDKKQENDEGKAELRLIRQTLTYKFMAQQYTYDDFVNYIKQSGKQQFGVSQIMNVLGEEPFLLGEESIETVIIYLFETDSLTGEESLNTKNFMKKMKKFLGKAKPINIEQEGQRINQLITIIQADQGGKKKLRKQFQKHDQGDGSISKQTFLSILKSMSIKSDLHETALSQIVLTSADINHLNYDIFLKRFAESQ